MPSLREKILGNEITNVLQSRYDTGDVGVAVRVSLYECPAKWIAAELSSRNGNLGRIEACGALFHTNCYFVACVVGALHLRRRVGESFHEDGSGVSQDNSGVSQDSSWVVRGRFVSDSRTETVVGCVTRATVLCGFC